jgi:hypothetical protein
MTAVLTRAEVVRLGPSGRPKPTLGWEALPWTAQFLRQPHGRS